LVDAFYYIGVDVPPDGGEHTDIARLCMLPVCPYWVA
jgi:hypothetical protein